MFEALGSLVNPIWLLVIFSFIVTIPNSVLAGVYIKDHCRNYSDHVRRYVFIAPAACFVALMSANFRISLSPLSVVCGIGCGLCSVIGAMLSSRAMETGPLVLCSVICNFTTVVCALSGILFFGDPALTLTQIVGFLLTISSIFLSIDYSKKDGGKKVGVAWVLLCLLSAAIAAAAALFQKGHQAVPEVKGELYSMMFVAWVTIISFGTLLSVILRIREEKTHSYVMTDRDRALSKGQHFLRIILFPIVVLGLLGGIGSVGGMYFVSAIPAVVYYPVSNVLPLLINAGIDLIVYKERFVWTQWVGILVGLCGVIILVF